MATEEDITKAYYEEEDKKVSQEYLEFGRLLDTGLWSDVTFVVGQGRKRFKVHKLILRAKSKHFNDLFVDSKNKSTFSFLNDDPDIFYLLMQLMYTGKWAEDAEDREAQLNIATKFEVSVPDLPKSNGTKDNAIKKYQEAFMCNDEVLTEKALKFICRSGSSIINSDQFLELSVQELTGIVGRDDLNISEDQLFDAVMNWARAECRRQNTLETNKYLRSVLETVIPLIRFPLMDPSEFASKVTSTNVLLIEEVVSILLYFSVEKETRASLPPGIFNAKPRAGGFTKSSKALKPARTKFILPRLVEVQDSVTQVKHLGTGISTGTGYTEIPLSSSEQRIRLKSSMPIWISSVGMNSGYGSSTRIRLNNNSDRPYYYSPVPIFSSKSVSVQLQVKDSEKLILASKTEAVAQDGNQITEVKHINFDQPVYIQKDEWYTVSVRVATGNFYAKNFTAADGDGTSLYMLLPDGSGRKIKFEFQNDDNPTYTGVNQGYIPEIGFLVD